jgi:hypothetical protein
MVVVLLVTGLFYFRRMEKTCADVVCVWILEGVRLARQLAANAVGADAQVGNARARAARI